MFKGYLREHPAIFQLSVFVGIWSTLQLITYLLLPKMISFLYGQNTSGIAGDGLSTQQEIDAYMMINGISSFLCFVLPPILFASVAAPKVMPYLEIKKDHLRRIALAVCLGIGMVLVFPILGHWINLANWGEAAKENMQQLIERNNAIFSDPDFSSLLRNLIVMALLPAIGEELFFRGMVQRFANSWLRNPRNAIIFTSLFFAFIHLQIVNFLPIFLASCLLGYIFHTTGNLLITIIVHFVYNSIQILLRYTPQNNENQNFEYIILFVIGLLISACCWYLFRRYQSPLSKNWGVHEPGESQGNKAIN
ncbi:MAG: CPBP family intramembrane metalloprotease [Taibaiella sp.]|nr:CPBP family intramembrane metalloprotease [Taibaiella sp.]